LSHLSVLHATHITLFDKMFRSKLGSGGNCWSQTDTNAAVEMSGAEDVAAVTIIVNIILAEAEIIVLRKGHRYVSGGCMEVQCKPYHR